MLKNLKERAEALEQALRDAWERMVPPAERPTTVGSLLTAEPRAA